MRALRVALALGVTMSLPAMCEAQPFGASAPLPGGGSAIASDLAGTWVAFGGSTFVRSTDDGQTWTSPQALDDRGYYYIELATDQHGLWVAVFAYNAIAPNGVGSALFTARSIDNGATWSTPVPIRGAVDPDVAGVSYPTITLDSTGQFIAIWMESRASTHFSRSAWISRSSDGMTWTPAEGFSSATGWDIRAAAGRNQTVIATFTASGIAYQRSTDGGVSWSDRRDLTTDGWSDRAPVVATDRNGVWIIAWRHVRELDAVTDYYTPVESDLAYVRSVDDGFSWTKPAWLNVNADRDRLDGDANVRIVANEHGLWTAVWEGATKHSGNSALVSWSRDSGATWEAPQFLSQGKRGDDYVYVWSPRVAAGGAGEWIGTWLELDYAQDSPISEAFFARAQCACLPCETCDAAGSCVAASRTDCAVIPDATKLIVHNRPGSGRDRLVWKFVAAQADAVPDLQDPQLEGTVGFCLYQADGTLAFRARAPAGLNCGNRSCWTENAGGFTYRKRNGRPDGLVLVTTRKKPDAAGHVMVAGEGANLSEPIWPLGLPLTAQLQIPGGPCWEAGFPEGGTIADRDTLFKAVSSP